MGAKLILKINFNLFFTVYTLLNRPPTMILFKYTREDQKIKK